MVLGLCRSCGYGFLSTVCMVYLEVGLGSGSIALCQDAINENTLYIVDKGVIDFPC
jgi:hypothetical protein